jgi:hypothetical protein
MNMKEALLERFSEAASGRLDVAEETGPVHRFAHKVP